MARAVIVDPAAAGTLGHSMLMGESAPGREITGRRDQLPGHRARSISLTIR